MANRRLFSSTVVESDAFLDMPLTSQALYFHIGMKADDDGFCSSVKTIMRMIGANQNDLDLLIAKSFLIKFEDGVVVVKHWRINNSIQNDRYKETEYTEDKRLLYLKPNKAYTLDQTKGSPLIGNNLETKCIQNVSKMETQVKLSKDKLSKGKTSKDKLEEVNTTPNAHEERIDGFDFVEVNGKPYDPNERF